MAKKKIILTAGKEELEFEVNSDNYNRYINEMAPNDKVLPAKRFLRRSLVKKEQNELLEDLLDKGQHLPMVGMLVEEFQGEIEIEVKK